MRLKVISSCARVVTLCATEKLLPTMNQHVSFQLISFDAGVSALVATLGLLSTVLKHVHFKVFGHLEGDVAQITCVIFVFRLHFHEVFSIQQV